MMPCETPVTDGSRTYFAVDKRRRGDENLKVRLGARAWVLAGIVVLAAMACGPAARAQGAPEATPQAPSSGTAPDTAPPDTASPATPPESVTLPGSSKPAVVEIQPTAIPAIKCVQPPPLISLMDYDGPLDKTVGAFANKLELRAVHQPHYQPGVVLCSLALKDKFILFLRDTYDPVTFVAAGFLAGIDQGIGRDRSFGGGGQGYAKRFGAEFVDQTSFKFFKDFAYPSLFGEDPRYYRMMEGPRKARLLHAIGHTFITHTDNGEPMFNFSEWLGTTSVVVLSNEYHPGNGRGFWPAAGGVSLAVGIDTGSDILREFWPDIARKLRLPFRVDTVPTAQ